MTFQVSLHEQQQQEKKNEPELNINYSFPGIELDAHDG